MDTAFIAKGEARWCQKVYLDRDRPGGSEQGRAHLQNVRRLLRRRIRSGL